MLGKSHWRGKPTSQRPPPPPPPPDPPPKRLTVLVELDDHRAAIKQLQEIAEKHADAIKQLQQCVYMRT